MTANITRCPHCQTTFRVRDEHLSIANGMVRCGSCLQVFQARDYFISTPSDSTPAPVPTLAVTLVKEEPEEKEDEIVIADDALIDDDFEIEKISDDPTTDYNLRAPDSQPRPKPSDDFSFEFDSSIFDLEDAGDLPFAAGENTKNKESDLDDEAWANALLDELDNEPNIEPASFEPKATIEKEDDAYHSEFLDDEELASISAPEDLLLHTDDSINPISANIADLHDDPIDLQEQGKNRPWGWMFGCLVLLGLAGAQFLFFNFDTLSRTPQWRPAYTSMCNILGCQVPDIQDINNFSTQLFAVKTHPHYQQALLAETLLLNKASYEQPFPDILLSFKDLNEKVIASRRFTPEQYLSGEMAGQTNIPPQTPVHIALEIVDPGAEAVSYNINLLANQ